MTFLFIANNAILSQSQVKFDFETGNISEWQQNISGRWEITSQNSIDGKSLHHAFDNTISDHDQISYLFSDYIDFKDSISWSFRIKHNYNPSSSNNWAVFLAADKPSNEMHPESSTISAYIIGVNYTGNDDLLKIWKVEKGKTSIILECELNWETLIGDTVTLINVSRSSKGYWEINTGKKGENTTMFRAGGVESLYTFQSRYFGIYYKYSSSQDQKLYIDDILINANFIKDTAGPVIDSFYVSVDNLEIYFNEAIDIGSLLLQNFEINPGHINPLSFKISGEKSLVLNYNEILVNGSDYNLQVSGIKDINGNEMYPALKNFSFYSPTQYDIIISEIMADPDPAVGLPESEYIELYNCSNFPINLKDWSLQTGQNKKVFSSITINPRDYIILCAEKSVDSFKNFGKAVGLWTDSYLINNTEGVISLSNNYGKLISIVSYSNEIYNDEFKINGGWALEMADLNKPCLNENWGPSEDANGGTPGKLNSILTQTSNDSAPFHYYTLVPDDTTVILGWSEIPDFSFLQDENMYKINNSIYPGKAAFYEKNFPSTQLTLTKNLISDKISTIRLTEKLFDCEGNKSNEETEIPFTKPEQPDSFDIVINEILYSPFDDGSEFIELFNRSQKIIDAGDLIIATIDTLTGKVKSFASVASKGFLFFPGEYIVLTSNVKGVEKFYTLKNRKSILKNSGLPALTNDYGSVALMTRQNRTIDKLTYSDKMHFTLLANTDGVSLERVSSDWPTQSYSNWHSASQSNGFGTPGYKNSQSFKEIPSSDNISISPEVFSPDNDGNEDFLTIKINLPTQNSIANITIYNSSGKVLKQLARNHYLGMENSFTWDGTSDERMLLPSGIYILHIRIQNEQGKTSEYKKICVLRRK